MLCPMTRCVAIAFLPLGNGLRTVEFPSAQEVIALLLERLNREYSNVTRDEERRSVFHGKSNQKVVSS